MAFYKIATKLLVFTLGLIVSVSSVGAHPLDISSTTFTIGKTSLEATTYFHPTQVESILGKSGLKMRDLTYGDYYTHMDVLAEYLKQQVSIVSQGNTCTLSDFTSQELTVQDIFTKGFPVSYRVSCPGEISDFIYRVSIYRELPLQTNRVLFLDVNGYRKSYKVLTSQIVEAEYSSTKKEILIDTDGDSLPDEEEKIYRTDPAVSDTDQDFYSDYEEVTLGWNPLSKDLSPGQSKRTEKVTGFILPEGIRQNTDIPAPSNEALLTNNTSPEGKETLTNRANTWAFGVIDRIRIKDFTLSDWLWFGPILILLGALHALGPGHSKGIMSLAIIQGGYSLPRAIGYAAVFTAVHLIDIVILSLLAKFVLDRFDVSEYQSAIFLGGAWILLGIALWLVYRATTQKVTQNEKWSGYTLAIISGLAPCGFAWILVLALFSIGRSDLIFPVVLCIALGVLIALVLVAVVVVYLRKNLTDRFRFLIRPFSVFGSILLLFWAIFLLSQVYGLT